MGECYSYNKNEDRIDTFVESLKLQKLQSEEAQESVEKKSLKEGKDDKKNNILSIGAFDVSDEGRVAIAATTGLHSGVINIFDANMNLNESFSYQYNNGVDFLMFEKNRVLFTGYKFHGVYVIDVNTKIISAYKWTNYDYIDKIYELGLNSPEKTRGGTNYYLSNSKKRRAVVYTDSSSFRYLIAEKGDDSKVLIDSGNTLPLFIIFTVIFFLGVATISIRRWINEIKRIREGK